MKRRKVFIGPCEIAGYYANLAKGLKELGVDFDYVTYVSHPFGYKGESNTPSILRLMRLFVSFYQKFYKWLLARVLFSCLAGLCRATWAFYAIFKYDCFIFAFGNSLLESNWDLKLIKMLGKRVIVNLGHGSDARPPYIDGSYQTFDGLPMFSMGKIRDITIAKRKRIFFFEKYADVIIGAPLSTSHFLTKNYINFFSIGIPFLPFCDEMEGDLEKGSVTADQVVRILHSPSHPAVKGTSLIKDAVESLIRKGYRIELILLHGRPHAEVLAAIQSCDFVVDQIYSDTPMAGFATEAAWFGKPAIVGGYGFEYLKTLLPKTSWPPSRICLPDNIEEAIEFFLKNRTERMALGRKAQIFVMENWSAVAVARRFLQLIDGNIPHNWWVNPVSVTYFHGIGLDENKLKSNIKELVGRFGVEALQLEHNKNLQSAMLEFADVKVNIK